MYTFELVHDPLYTYRPDRLTLEQVKYIQSNEVGYWMLYQVDSGEPWVVQCGQLRHVGPTFSLPKNWDLVWKV